MTTSAIDIATSIIDKLQHENSVSLETLHKAQDTIKQFQRQLSEKERIIKVLEERIRCGNDGILEMTNRQKELTIKHLEIQIQKLLQENEELEIRLEAIKSEICPKCETKLLLRENSENRYVPKSYKTLGKSGSALHDKKPSQTVCPSRVKALERIIEHKDKRILHLSKEIKKLTNTEKELTEKVYRLTKLLPMSRLPPETLTDCLLKEIQILESQNQGCNDNIDKMMTDTLNKIKKNYSSTHQATKSKVVSSKSSTAFKKPSSSSLKTSSVSVPDSKASEALDSNKAENEVLLSRLQKLCNDINDLKRLFVSESEKLSHGLNSTVNEYRIFKMRFEEIINNLNEIVKSIFSCDLSVKQKPSLGDESDEKYVISCMQERLKESLKLITEYENENKELKENLDKLKSELKQQSSYSDHLTKIGQRTFRSLSDLKEVSNINDVKKLQEIIKNKETQLQAAESHIKTCLNFIDELQKSIGHTGSKLQSAPSAVNETVVNSYEQENKTLQTKLDVAEKNIKTCETVIEQLKNTMQHLEEANVRLESELHQMKSKAMSEEVGYQSCDFHSKLSDSHVNLLKKVNQEFQDKVKVLEETNAKLKQDKESLESKAVLLKASEQKNSLLQSKVDASEKQICALEKSVEALQEKLKTVEDQKNDLETELRKITVTNTMAETYENDVMALKNALILKEDENRELKESLHTLENKTLEMNHYRMSLHEEIENLCKALMENEESEDSERRKAIYKAAVLHSAQALLRLDDNYNFKPDDSGRSSALDELKHQIQVYLTEVSRIHELVTIKEQERDELLREYLDLQDIATLRPSPPRSHESHIQGQPSKDDLRSSPDFNHLKSPSLPVREDATVKSTTATDKTTKPISFMSDAEVKSLQDELIATKSVTAYLLSSCTRVEDLLTKERTERARCERELEVCQETVRDLKAQLNMKSSTAKRLNSLIERMRSKEYTDEITLEQLKSEIKWLIDENQKIFQKIVSTQSELSQCKEENCRILNKVETLNRELLDVKYEKAKMNSELNHLRLQVSNSQLTLQDTMFV